MDSLICLGGGMLPHMRWRKEFVYQSIDQKHQDHVQSIFLQNTHSLSLTVPHSNRRTREKYLSLNDNSVMQNTFHSYSITFMITH